ncbi:N-6 DNA methylase [Vibrio splendidus]
MNSKLNGLIKLLSKSKSNEPLALVEQYAACCAWVKLMHDDALDTELFFDDKPDSHSMQWMKELVQRVMNEHVSVNFNVGNWQMTDHELHVIVRELKYVTNSKIVSFKELSDSIKQMLDVEGKRIGQLSIPDELTSLGVALLKDKVASVYCPFTAGYEFAHQLPYTSVVEGETPSSSDVFLGAVHGILLDQKFYSSQTDPILTPTLLDTEGLKQFESSIALPPLGQKYPRFELNDYWDRFPEQSLMGDVLQLRHMLAHSTDRVVCFVTNGFLFRSAAGEKQFKVDMVERSWLEAVIALPASLLPSTSVPLSVVVLNKNKHDDNIMFIDASSDDFVDKSSRTRNLFVGADKVIDLINDPKDSDISKIASKQGVAELDFNLSPARYVQTEDDAALNAFLSKYSLQKLSELVDIIRTQAVKHTEGGETSFVEHNLTSLDSVGRLSRIGKTVDVSSKDLAKAVKQQIKQGDVLVSCRGSVGRIALIDYPIDDNSIASQAFAILRVKETVAKVTSISLYQYLSSPLGQQQLASLVTGTTAQMLSAKDLSNLEVPIFERATIEKMEQIRSEVLGIQQSINELEAKKQQISSSWID